MLKAEHHRIATREIAGIKISVQSYQIGDKFYCHVSNLDPGATIARAAAASLADAEREALLKAAERLQRKANWFDREFEISNGNEAADSAPLGRSRSR